MKMRPRYLLVAALLVFTACAPPADSGIQGHISAGPTCPVVRVDVPCPDQPYAGTLTILAEKTGFRIAQVTADATGYYRVSLAPGTYVVQPESPGVMPRGTDITVVVLPHSFTTQDIVYDTGIR
ncbi:MAG TPA: hypothetical protein VIU38_12365 [Anaerolineales bacterium]